MSKHTPGPWEWGGDDNDLVIRPQRIPEDNKVFVIAVLPLKSYEHLEDWSECSWSAEGEADARLIAAAPDMEDWIRAALKQFEAQAQVLINNSSIIDDANKFKKEPVVKLILSGRDILSRVEGDEAE